METAQTKSPSGPAPLTEHTFYKIPELPFEFDAMEPVLSTEAIDYHYDKHAKGYFKKTNELIGGTGLEGLPLEDVVKRAKGKLFNQAAQAWNHVFFFDCLASPDSKKISPALRSVLTKNFGSVETFFESFAHEAAEVFGTGWAWLAKLPNGSLKISGLQDADTPLTRGQQPLLTCDVWEHAYYLDYRNDRETYLDAFERIINWDFVESNYDRSAERLQ